MIALLLAATLAWWPGGAHGIDGTQYHHRVPVIDDAGGSAWYHRNLRAAIRDWNACGVLRLVIDRDAAPYTPETITVFEDRDGKDPEPAYGGWNGTAGIVAVGEPWTRSRPVLAHELGHALGFGHGGDGIMGGGNHVTPTDCAGLRSFYGS